MLDKLFKGFRREEEIEEDELTLPRATAALLVEAARADEEYTDKERDLIAKRLAAKFSLTPDQARTLRIEAETDQAEANDLYTFSSVVKDGLDHQGRIALIEDMWRVVLTDDERDPFEEQVIRRLVGLLHLEDRESQLARQRVEAAS